MTTLRIKWTLTRLSLAMIFCWTSTSWASDHADPIFNKSDDAGLTGLFVFPDDDDLILILNIHRGLKTPGPFKLDPYRYTIKLDTNSRIHFKNAENNLRYGGTVAQPENIAENASITITLNNDATINTFDTTGFPDQKAFKHWSGVRDDPFIFPKFFGTNVISMVMSLPKNKLPEHDGQFLVWAITEKKHLLSWEQIDHVGRSARTQNPRLDFLNTLPPSEHVAAIKKEHDNPTFLQKELMSHIQPLFGIRHYDFFPDVMIYSSKHAPGFPNGRKLDDDVAALTCRLGDCLLWELSFADSDTFPRQTTNDKAFLSTFPYLAEPW